MDYGWVTIIGNVPSKSNCYEIIQKGGHASLSKKDALARYENNFYIQCPGNLRNAKINKYFEFYCRVYYPSQRSDLDNSLKVQLDCLQHTKTITNDNKCVKIVAEKFLDARNPRVEFKIITID